MLIHVDLFHVAYIVQIYITAQTSSHAFLSPIWLTLYLSQAHIHKVCKPTQGQGEHTLEGYWFFRRVP